MARATSPITSPPPILTALHSGVLQSVTVIRRCRREVAQRIVAKTRHPGLQRVHRVLCQYYARRSFCSTSRPLLPPPTEGHLGGHHPAHPAEASMGDRRRSRVFPQIVPASPCGASCPTGLSSGFRAGKAGAEAVIAAAGFDANVRGETRASRNLPDR